MAETVTKEELDAAFSNLEITIMENVNRELEQRVKTVDFQQELESADMLELWKPPEPDTTSLQDKMVELEAQLIYDGKATA